jgi:hypothetical protein
MLAASLMGAPLISFAATVSPISHAYASSYSGYISDMTTISQGLTDQDKTTVRSVRDFIKSKGQDSTWWKGIVNNPSFEQALKDKGYTYDDVSAMFSDLISLFYTLEDTQTEVDSFKSKYSDQFHAIFGNDVTVDELMSFAKAVKQDAMTRVMFNQVFNSNATLNDTINKSVESTLNDSTYSNLNNQLGALSLSVADVLTIKDRFTTTVDEATINGATNQATAARNIMIAAVAKQYVSLNVDGDKAVTSITGHISDTKKLALNATYNSTSATVSSGIVWSVDNTQVASITQDGTLTLNALGTATVSATLKGITLFKAPIQVNNGAQALNSQQDSYGDITITANDFAAGSNTLSLGNSAYRHTHHGTIYLNPGAARSVILRNITADSIVVQSGASQSIDLYGVQTGSLNVDTTGNQTNPVHVLADATSRITTTTVNSQVILEGSSSGSLGNVTVGSGATGGVELRGSIGTVTVSSSNVTVTVASGASVNQLQVTAPISLVVNGTVSTLQKDANVTLSGTGGTIGSQTGTGTVTGTIAPAPIVSSGGGGGGGAPSVSTMSIVAANGGTVTINGVTIAIPANALSKDFKVTVNQISSTDLPINQGLELQGNVYELTKNVDGTFSSPVTVKLPFDVAKVNKEQQKVGIYWYNADTKTWVELDNVNIDWTSGKVSGDVSHFTKFAVLATSKPTTVTPAPVPGQVQLNDIQGHWAESVINKLVQKGAISGYPDGSFKPDKEITRAEFATVLVSSLKLPIVTDKVFDDTKDHWAKNFIATAAANGIVHGYDESTFGADDPITREQMAAMVINALKLDPATGGKVFADRDAVSAWAQKAVETASADSIINGYPDDTFRPAGHATRAEAAAVIVNALKF